MAESPRGLRRRMFQLQAKYGAQLIFTGQYSFVDKDGKTKHIAWYVRPLKNLKELE